MCVHTCVWINLLVILNSFKNTGRSIWIHSGGQCPDGWRYKQTSKLAMTMSSPTRLRNQGCTQMCRSCFMCTPPHLGTAPSTSRGHSQRLADGAKGPWISQRPAARGLSPVAGIPGPCCVPGPGFLPASWLHLTRQCELGWSSTDYVMHCVADMKSPRLRRPQGTSQGRSGSFSFRVRIAVVLTKEIEMKRRWQATLL